MAEEFNLEIIPLNIPEDWQIIEKQAGYQFYPHLTAGEGFYICCLRKKEDQNSSIEKRKSKNKRQDKINWLSRKEAEVVKPWLASPEQFRFYQTEDQRIWAVLKDQEEAVSKISNTLKHCQIGTEIGILKNKKLVPSPALALSTIIHPNLPYIELERDAALKYLKKETFPLEQIPEGWALMRYNGLNLGWIKGLRNRFNNYYPKEWRIRMSIE
jgi:NOL1/NOP2/fmu family ribosome biogenesis protein